MCESCGLSTLTTRESCNFALPIVYVRVRVRERFVYFSCFRFFENSLLFFVIVFSAHCYYQIKAFHSIESPSVYFPTGFSVQANAVVAPTAADAAFAVADIKPPT